MDHPAYLLFVKRIIACLNGLAKAPPGQDETLQKLFDAFFQAITSPNPSQGHVSKGNSFQHLLKQQDEVLMLFAKMLRDYSEYQLSRLYDTSARLLYSTVAMVLSIFQQRLAVFQSFTLLLPSEQGNATSPRRNQDVLYEENIDFINEALHLLLEILNHLSTKEFLFSEYPVMLSPSSVMGTKTDAQHDIPSVLIFGLQMMIPLIQLPILTSYPPIVEKYLSFLLFLCNSSMKSLMIWWNHQLSAEQSLQYFVLLMKQLLIAMGGVDGTTARMAIQVSELS